jgi:hypothetical protein
MENVIVLFVVRMNRGLYSSTDESRRRGDLDAVRIRLRLIFQARVNYSNTTQNGVWF